MPVCAYVCVCVYACVCLCVCVYMCVSLCVHVCFNRSEGEFKLSCGITEAQCKYSQQKREREQLSPRHTPCQPVLGTSLLLNVISNVLVPVKCSFSNC